jgi:hypothetical protein
MNPAEELTLHELCRTADVLDRLHAEITATDAVVKGSRGQPRANPVYAMRVEWVRMLELLTRRLALPDDYAATKRSDSASNAANTRWKGVVR